MLTSDQRAQFDTDGFLLVKGALDADDVKRIRAVVAEAHAVEPSDPTLPPGVVYDDLLRCPPLDWLVFHPRIIEVVTSLLDDPHLLPITDLQVDQFGPWHRDTETAERHSHSYHVAPDYRFVNVACYLQPNTPELGGGLEVEPGSHRALRPIRVGLTGTKLGFGQETHRANVPFERVAIPSEPGDLVAFHFNLRHRATRGSQHNQPKVGVFQTWSDGQQHVPAFLEFARTRKAYAHLAGPGWPSAYADGARAAGVALADFALSPSDTSHSHDVA